VPHRPIVTGFSTQVPTESEPPMATAAQLARQFQRELEAKKEGETRLLERTRAAEDSNYASSTVYGLALIREGLDAVTKEIETKISRITAGWATQDAASVAMVKSCEPATLALITAKVLLDLNLVERRMTYAKACTAVGRYVRDEVVLSAFQENHSEDYGKAAFYQHKHKGYVYRFKSFQAKMRKVNAQVPKWTNLQSHKVGGWLIDRLVTATGWYTAYDWLDPRRRLRGGGAPTIKILAPSQEFLDARQALLQRAEALAACHWPMLCEPNDWSDKTKGGFLTAELRYGQRLVRTKSRGGCSPVLEGTKALQMLNTLQKVPYRINISVLDIANLMSEKRITLGSFKNQDPIEPPLKPDWETATDEVKLDYKRMRTKVEDFNASISQNNYRTNECLFVANKYRDEESFWIPWSFDFRGRVYPLVTSLSPQGTDFDKSLFLFAEEGPVDPYWLAFQVATTWGLDKASMNDRQAWAKDNHDLISRIAKDPLDNLSEWSLAEEPWCFLAACVEYNDCVIEQTRSTSGLPVSVDATCSGLQHLSALTKDLSAAQMVNVVPTDKPTDAYAVVAEKAKEFLPEAYHPLMNRKVTKRTVMTTPYGVTMNSARGYIREELPKTFEDESPVELSLVTRAVYHQAIPAVIPGPIKAMGYIQRAAVEHIDQGNPLVKWVTPSGFTVIQDSRVMEMERVSTKLMGSRVQTSVCKPWEELEVNRKGHRGGSAPNLIHSLDAALLHLTYAECDRPFTLIHDCVLMRSCDLSWINTQLRQVFVEMYSQPILEDWANQLGVGFDPDVMINTLDIKDAINSTYLFC
jgi:DNA-directed RNA polymerase